MRRIETAIARASGSAPTRAGERYFPHEFIYRILRSGALEKHYQIDPKDSLAAGGVREEPADLRARLGGLDARQHLRRALHRAATSRTSHTVRTGIEYMMALADWYRDDVAEALDRLLPDRRRHRRRLPDLRRADAAPGPAAAPTCRCWGYFCQISDSTTSYGSYSGAVPNEKITWGKLGVDTPKFIIESDATIVAPLIFAYVLGRISPASGENSRCRRNPRSNPRPPSGRSRTPPSSTGSRAGATRSSS